MEQSMKANPSIQCSVERCHYHNNEKNVCSLAAIQVGTCGLYARFTVNSLGVGGVAGLADPLVAFELAVFLVTAPAACHVFVVYSGVFHLASVVKGLPADA